MHEPLESCLIAVVDDAFNLIEEELLFQGVCEMNEVEPVHAEQSVVELNDDTT